MRIVEVKGKKVKLKCPDGYVWELLFSTNGRPCGPYRREKWDTPTRKESSASHEDVLSSLINYEE